MVDLGQISNWEISMKTNINNFPVSEKDFYENKHNNRTVMLVQIHNWKNNFETELKEELQICESYNCPIFLKIDGYPLCEFCVRKEILAK
jgi:hypothetical protein